MAGAFGVFRTELAALAQQHFGPGLDARHLPGSWSSTANSLEYAAFLAADTLFVVDDFAPGGSSSDVTRYHREADRLLRAAGNHSGRQRMRADGTLRPMKPPRALIVSTGEDVPRGQSLRARLLILDVSKGDIDEGRLTACQHDAAAGLYAGAMAAFVGWLAPQLDDVRRRWPSDLAAIRAEVTANGQHARTPGIVADLLLGWRTFLLFAQNVAAIDERQAKSLADRGRRAIEAAADRQAEHQQANEPAAHFVRLLAAALASGRCHIARLDGCKPTNSAAWGWRQGEPQGQLIGWLDEELILLEPDAAYAAVQRFSGDQGEAIAVGSSTLRKRLHERGYLAKTDPARETLTVRRKIDGTARNVLILRPLSLPAENPTNPTTAPESANAASTSECRVLDSEPDKPDIDPGKPDNGDGRKPDNAVGCCRLASENPTSGNGDGASGCGPLVGNVGFSAGVENDSQGNSESAADGRERFVF